MQSKKRNKFLSVLIVLTLVLGSSITGFGASPFSDTSGHWAESSIQEAASMGFIKGYANGTFKPDNPVTRAEFSRMLNVVLGLTNQVSTGFQDVNSTEWYYGEVRKAVSAGFISGYADNTFRPNSKITRQEAAVMISRVLPPAVSAPSLAGFDDSSSISDWARSAVAAVYTAGYMKGDNRNRYRPLGPLTRAEAATILAKYAKEQNIITADTTVTSSTTLSDKIYANDLTIDRTLGDDDLTICGCVILGTLTINGGGKNTVTLEDSVVQNMVVSKTTGDVRILLSGYSAVRQTSLVYGAILEQDNLYGEGFQIVDLDGIPLSIQKVTLAGSFREVNLNARSILEQLQGNIGTLTVNASAAGSSVETNQGTTINTAVLNGKTTFTGSGRILTTKDNVAVTVTENSDVTPQPLPSTGGSGPQPSFSPADGATKVDMGRNIQITFHETIFDASGGEATNSDISSMVELRTGSATGAKVFYTATIDASKQIITLDPVFDLTRNTDYYVILLSGSIKDVDGNAIGRISSTFKTGSPAIEAPAITSYPVVHSLLQNDDTATITLTCATSGVTMYYTLDASAPSAAATRYTAPFEISTSKSGGETIFIKAIATKPGMPDSEVSSTFLVFLPK